MSQTWSLITTIYFSDSYKSLHSKFVKRKENLCAITAVIAQWFSSVMAKLRNTEDTGSITDSAIAGILLQYHHLLVTVRHPLHLRRQHVKMTPLQVHSEKETVEEQLKNSTAPQCYVPQLRRRKTSTISPRLQHRCFPWLSTTLSKNNTKTKTIQLIIK